jgi:methylenetetrahydrofolate dehydrogenase (NADP+)/methenyltetrahydrofolate cyclohydrolase
MIIDGKAMAAQVLQSTRERAVRLPHTPRVLAVVANETPATKSYLSIKGKRAADAGCELEVERLPADASQAALTSVVQNAKADVVLVQLPLPPQVTSEQVCDAIPLIKDADVLSNEARHAFEEGSEESLLPPVVGAIKKILDAHKVVIQGKKVVVIGAGFLVGAPAATWFRREGASVRVLDIDTPQSEFEAELVTADIIVSGAGSPALIKPRFIKEGVVVIDAGTSESNGVIVGDADPLCAEKCSLFTPVPGGMGPLAVACLFENAVTLVERATSAS